MNSSSKFVLITALALIHFCVSCTKGNHTSDGSNPKPPIRDTAALASPCKSIIYGFTAAANSIYDSITNCSIGILNTSKATMSVLGMFNSALILNNAAFNTNENCYYTFAITTYWAGSDRSTAPLYRITKDGVVTALGNSETKSRYTGLTYNRITNKLYCLKKDSIVEIAIVGNTFTTINLAKPLYPFARSFTTDKVTGDMYYLTIDTPVSEFHIEKYRPGSVAPVSINIGSGGATGTNPINLCFNENDTMLYGTVVTPPSGFEFVKIDPKSGTISQISYHNIYLNPFFVSTCIDPCSNRYIISNILDHWGIYPPTCILLQLSLTGEEVKIDTTATYFSGLIAK